MLDVLETAPVLVGFTDREGGVSPAPYDALTLAEPVRPVLDARADPVSWDAVVAENLDRLSRSLPRAAGRGDLAPPTLALMRQVHGADVVVVDDDHAPELLGRSGPDLPAADALVTTRRDVALCVRVADCVPVLLADAGAGVVAAVHAGRAGVASDVVGAALTAMRHLGAQAVRAWVGPSICGACYEVPPAMAEDVAAVVPAARTTTRQGTTGLDLPAAVLSQLAGGGVADVTHVDRCTREDATLFSHRRDADASGRFAGVVWLPPVPA